MPTAVFEPAIPASERFQTHALEHAATGIRHQKYTYANWKYPVRVLSIQG
jgi:hypothetical protein